MPCRRMTRDVLVLTRPTKMKKMNNGMIVTMGGIMRVDRIQKDRWNFMFPGYLKRANA